MKRFHRMLTAGLAALLVASFSWTAGAAVFDTLRPGFEGAPVLAMQSGLHFLGFSLTVDGKYGPRTEDAVKAFQRVNRLADDGLAGNLTLNELYRQAPQFMPSNGAAPAPAQTAPPLNTQAPAQPGPTAGSAGTAYVYTENGGSLNLRNRPSRGQTTIAQLPFGTQVTVFGTSDGWANIQALGRTGYVMASFLRSSPPGNPQPAPSQAPQPTSAPTASNPPDALPQSPPQPASGQAFVDTANRRSLNLRESPSTGARVLYQMPYLSQVSVLARQGTWTQVAFRQWTGYVMDSFLRHGSQGSASDQPAPTASAQPSPAPAEPSGSPSVDAARGIAFVNTQNGRTLNLRGAANTGDNIIGQLPFGAALLLVGRGEFWCEVIYNGQQGFVMTSFLRFDVPGAPATPTPAATPDPTPQPSATASPSPDPAATPAPPFPETLRLNDKGDAVLDLQKRLIALKYTVSRTSVYDQMTREAVAHFQLQNGLTADGVFGPASAAVLLSGKARLADSPPLSYNTLRIDNRDQTAGGPISAMQQALQSLGFKVSVNGRFDIDTHQAVVGFQQRNGLPISGIANALTQSTLYSGGANGASAPVETLGADEGKGGGPSTSDVKLLHWFNDIKPRFASGQRVTVYHPASGTSFTIRFYSLGNHADSEPATWRDTQLMNRAFGTPSWNINTVYVKLPDSRWTLAAMHNRPHLTGAINDNGFGGHLCIHFLRDMEEVNRNDPDYGASNQRAIRKAWLNMTGETID